MVEHPRFLGIRTISKADQKIISACALKWAFWIKVYHCGNGETFPTDKPPGEFQEMLTGFLGLLRERTYSTSQKWRQNNVMIQMNPNGKILFRSPYTMYSHKVEHTLTQMEKTIPCSWNLPPWSDFTSPVLFVRKPDSILCICILYCSVNAISFMDSYHLPHMVYCLSCMHSSDWSTIFDFMAPYYQICIATANRLKMTNISQFGWYNSRVLLFGLAYPFSQFMCMMNSILETMESKFIIV